MSSLVSRFVIGAASASFLIAGTTLANAQETGLSRGDAVVTGFSGIKPSDKPLPPGANPLDHFFIDLEGPSAQIMSMTGLGGQPKGQLVTPAPKRQIKAGEIGQVFAIALDDGGEGKVPNIYLGATSAYGIQIVGPDSDGDGEPNRIKTGAPGAEFMAGQFGPQPDGNPGTIWRVDGATGAISAFTTLPGNSGPGVGDIAFDKRSRNIYASDLDQGLIHRVGPDGLVINSFDHGVNGRPAKGLAPLADDGRVMTITSPAFDSQNPDTWGYTQKDRMVYGMAVHNGRLFYAVTGGLQIWSIGLRDDGDFDGPPSWELDVTSLPGNGPITDIAFDKEGRMLLAQRGIAKGSYDYSLFAAPGKSAVVRYSLEQPDNAATESVWREQADDYAIGMAAPHNFANGGIALGYAHDENGSPKPGTCSTMLWSTGSRLRSSEKPDEVDAGIAETADVHGLQGNDLSLVRPQNVPPAQSYFADYDDQFGDPEKAGHMGDVEIWQPCDTVDFGAAPGNFPPGYEFPSEEPEDFPEDFPPPVRDFNTNLRLTKHATQQICFPGFGGYVCRYQVRVRNMGPGFYHGSILVSDTLPAAPAGALMGFGPGPTWSCWNNGTSSYRCLRGPTFLAPGASVALNVAVLVPNTYQACVLQNIAELEWAPGGTRWNTDPTDDIDSATALIPDENCPPPAGPTNLSLKKTADPEMCTDTGSGFRCRYRVTVTNNGPGVYNGPIQILDRPQAGTNAVFSWPCIAAGPDFSCTLPPASLLPFQQTFMWSWLDVPNNVAQANSCSIQNRARITFAPGGSLQNTDPTDDSGFAVAQIDASFCAKVLQKAVTPPPPISCPPGYRLRNGKCERKRRKVCPEGTVGKYPNCRDRIVDPPKVCPPGTYGKWPRCRENVREVCPEGTYGRYPNCKPRRCGHGYVGRWPNCRPAEKETCPRGTHGTFPNCQPNVCKPGTTGKWPRCRPIRECPHGTYGKYPRCKPKVCTHGMVGKWPNCKPEVRECPKGTFGKYPRCKPKACRRGMQGIWPNCKPNVCKPGYIGKWPRCRPAVKNCPTGTRGKWPRCKPIITKRCPSGTRGRWPACRPIINKRCPSGTRGKWPACRPIIQKRCPRGTVGRWPNCRARGQTGPSRPKIRRQFNKVQQRFNNARNRFRN